MIRKGAAVGRRVCSRTAPNQPVQRLRGGGPDIQGSQTAFLSCGLQLVKYPMMGRRNCSQPGLRRARMLSAGSGRAGAGDAVQRARCPCALDVQAKAQLPPVTSGIKVNKLRSADKIRGRQIMTRLLVLLAAACIFTTASVAIAPAQVTGIRHSDGSWTFVDSKGRDIHKDYAGQAPRDGNRGHRHRTSRPDKAGHRVGGYLPWQSR
jgi:hypothetical protein